MGHILRRRELQAMGHPWLGFRRAAALCRRAAVARLGVGGGEGWRPWEAAAAGALVGRACMGREPFSFSWCRREGERGSIFWGFFFVSPALRSTDRKNQRGSRAGPYTLSPTLELLARLGYADTYCVYKCLPTVLVSPEQCRQLICSHTTSLPTDYMTLKGCTITNR